MKTNWLATILFAFALSACTGDTVEMRNAKVQLRQAYPGRLKITYSDEYPVTAAQQATLYWQADALLSVDDAERFVSSPEKIVGKVVELRFLHGGRSYQLFNYYEDNRKKFVYLAETSN